MGLGDSLRDVGGDFMQMLAALGILFGFVFLFWIWGTGGTWVLIVILLLVGLGFLAYKAYQGGWRMNF